jgi:cation diffusion facilitator family transporter
MSSEGSRRAVVFAIAANVAIAVLKFVAAAVTGSAAMLAEGIHSVVDTGDGALLYVGIARARLPPDEQHPFGHGKEVYFWTLVVAVLVFAVGGGMSMYEGITHLVHGQPLARVGWSYAVLAGSALFEGTSWAVAWRQFARERRGRGVWRALETSKDPTTFSVLLEDSAALIGLLAAFVGVSLGHAFHSSVPDALASLVIGAVLMATAIVLARATLRLLVGESADRELLDGIRQLVCADPAVERVGRVLAVHFGPDDVVAQLQLFFGPSLTAEEVARAIDRLQRELRQRFPMLKSISVEAESFAAAAAPLPGQTR